MRNPKNIEMKVLRRFVGSCVEKPDAFPGAGPKTFAGMVSMGWIEWIESTETNECGYGITKKGQMAKCE